MTMRVAFYKGTQSGTQGLVNRLVRWWTRGPYSHCELVWSDSKIGDVSICSSSSMMDGGVRVKAINVDTSDWDCIDIAGNESAAHQWFQEHDGQRYNLQGDFGFIWRPLKSSRRKWFCSEAVAAALEFKEPWRFDPNTLAAVIRSIVTR